MSYPPYSYMAGFGFLKGFLAGFILGAWFDYLVAPHIMLWLVEHVY